MQQITKICFLFCCFLCLESLAQHTQHQTIEVENIEKIALYLDEVFAVEIVTGNFSSIQLISEAEGEYAEELQLEVKQIQETLYIHSLFDAILTSGFDKLSSHKVFAFQLKILIPETLQVYVESNIAEVNVHGKLSYFEADLKNGNCMMDNHQGDVKINTYRGNISIKTKDASIDAETRRGQLQLDQALLKRYGLSLKSIEGNIQVIQLN